MSKDTFKTSHKFTFKTKTIEGDNSSYSSFNSQNGEPSALQDSYQFQWQGDKPSTKEEAIALVKEQFRAQGVHDAPPELVEVMASSILGDQVSQNIMGDFYNQLMNEAEEGKVRIISDPNKQYSEEEARQLVEQQLAQQEISISDGDFNRLIYALVNKPADADFSSDMHTTHDANDRSRFRYDGHSDNSSAWFEPSPRKSQTKAPKTASHSMRKKRKAGTNRLSDKILKIIVVIFVIVGALKLISIM
ncbi:hypothetical protein [Vibrio rhizosphaerae]|uniref:Uncharacterized protein n=1 Tax=Vibrio rhizosphaerae TaxID=398736 RepID=A0ABU4J0U4_9VIBR|nr:hypothetical protein [Vibrio rhizosphaerae]MDW6094763.1 hypothetical protein [Vibrio rhizosphaerae]